MFGGSDQFIIKEENREAINVKTAKQTGVNKSPFQRGHKSRFKVHLGIKIEKNSQIETDSVEILLFLQHR